jgi:hypothetical protein
MVEVVAVGQSTAVVDKSGPVVAALLLAKMVLTRCKLPSAWYKPPPVATAVLSAKVSFSSQTVPAAA